MESRFVGGLHWGTLPSALNPAQGFVLEAGFFLGAPWTSCDARIPLELLRQPTENQLGMHYDLRGYTRDEPPSGCGSKPMVPF